MAAHFSRRVGFRRLSLAGQAARALREAVEAGGIAGEFPPERELAEGLNVSRAVLREALGILEKEGVIEKRQGRASRVREGKEPARAKPEVIVLSGHLPGNQPALDNPVLLALSRAEEWGEVPFSIRMDARFLGRRADRLLRNLVSRHPGAAWGLFGVSQAVQSWFERARLPAVVIGSCHPGVRLPSFNHDFAAIGRHAAGMFSRAGRSRILIALPEAMRAGNRKTLEAFVGGLVPVPGATHQILPGNDDLAQWLAAFRKKLDPPETPDGFFCFNPAQALTALIQLSARGLRQNHEFLLACVESDPLFVRILPAIPSYQLDHPRLARLVARALLRACRGTRLPATQRTLTPKATG